jgi:hypothetical protein
VNEENRRGREIREREREGRDEIEKGDKERELEVIYEHT